MRPSAVRVLEEWAGRGKPDVQHRAVAKAHDPRRLGNRYPSEMR